MTKTGTCATSPAYARCALLIAVAFAAACSDPAGPDPDPAELVAATAMVQDVPLGSVPTLPTVQVRSVSGRPVPGVQVRFVVTSGAGTVTGADQVTGPDGRATVGSWTLGPGPGPNAITATADELPGIHLVFEAIALPDGCTRLITLDHDLGEFERIRTASSPFPCIMFDPDRAGGHEYLVLLENLAPTGGFETALFPGPEPADTSFAFTFDVEPDGPVVTSPIVIRSAMMPAPHPVHLEATWDFGAGTVRELMPEPGIAVAEPVLHRGGGIVNLSNATVDPQIGDTISVTMVAVPRLSIAAGEQQAVIRYVSDLLIIAEDVRLTTALMREGGGFNTPLTFADMEAIADEYAAYASVQGDLLFESGYNMAIEANQNRITAVHSLMPADDIWGYTFPSANYLVWDYWVATDGVTKGLNQHPQRVADNIFMHEIAHMRQMGLIERMGGGLSKRGNRWLAEGFARFAERLPIAARLLESPTPSRIANRELPKNDAFGNAYFMDDVPTYLHAGSSLYFGYHTSSFVFDYFADRVELNGGDWLTAMREFVVAGDSAGKLDAVVRKWLPDSSFTEMLTRARMALYTDDIGTTGLPEWTQYHQYNLRLSRPAPDTAAYRDPRALWMGIDMTKTATVTGSVGSGGAVGYILSGAPTDPVAILHLSGPAGPHARAAIARIR